MLLFFFVIVNFFAGFVGIKTRLEVAAVRFAVSLAIYGDHWSAASMSLIACTVLSCVHIASETLIRIPTAVVGKALFS